MTTNIAEPTILSTRLFDDQGRRRHPQREVCPGCQAKLTTVRLIDLAYVFTRCSCSKEDYRHLYEQLWHLRCLAVATTDEEGAER